MYLSFLCFMIHVSRRLHKCNLPKCPTAFPLLHILTEIVQRKQDSKPFIRHKDNRTLGASSMASSKSFSYWLKSFLLIIHTEICLIRSATSRKRGFI